jgi:hypothetical protein
MYVHTYIHTYVELEKAFDDFTLHPGVTDIRPIWSENDPNAFQPFGCKFYFRRFFEKPGANPTTPAFTNKALASYVEYFQQRRRNYIFCV